MKLKAGITIIEVLIVMSIMGLLFAFLFPALNPLKETTIFRNKITAIQESILSQRMKAQGGYSSSPTQQQERDAFGVTFKKQSATSAGAEIFETSYSTNSTNTFQSSSITLQKHDIAHPYNLLSRDSTFANQSNQPSLAQITSLTITSTQGTQEKQEISLVFLPNSNTYQILTPEGTVVEADYITVSIASIAHPSLKTSFKIIPSTGSIEHF